MEEFSKNGRKLRPRKTSSENRSTSERVSSSEEHKTYDGSERRSYGSAQRRPFSDRRAYGEGERRSYGEHRPAADRERRNFGEGRQAEGGEHRNFGGNRQNGGSGHRSYGSAPRRPFSDRRVSDEGERHSFGEGRSYGDKERKPFNGTRRPAFGGRKPTFGARRQTPQFSKESEEGINRMLSRKSVISSENDNYREDKFQETAKDEIRLNKFIANSGVCSRREADTLIQAGVVTVNGEVVTELGTKINIFNDDVRFNGERLKGEEKVYIVMNKPAGYVTTSSDPHADKTVMDLLKNCNSRVFPVGRLDKATTGVLMFTNDGEISERLTHPSYNKKKIYQVILNRELSQEDFDNILSGVTLSDGDVAADELEFIDENDHRKLGIEIHSGKNRIVRRIFESLGYDVRALDRVYFAGLTKKGLKKGEWRFLNESEVNILKMGAYV